MKKKYTFQISKKNWDAIMHKYLIKVNSVAVVKMFK